MKNMILVTGATGFQGGAVAKELLKTGHKVRALVPEGEDANPLKAQGIECVTGSFEDLDSLKKAFEGVEKVYLSFPLIFDEQKLLAYAEHIVKAWESSSVSHFVFNTNLPVFHQEVGMAAFDIKLKLERFFDEKQLPYISLRPTIYMDNLSAPFLLPVVREKGILPYPIAAENKVEWLSHQDLAKFVRVALQKPELAGEKFFVGGLQLINGEEMAAVISKLAKKKISYIPLSPDDFEAQLSPSFGQETAKEISNIYRFAQEHPNHLEATDLREKTLIHLPANLQLFEEWASGVRWS
ncbi:SDR family oxidoreductase [Algoriphagus sp.]|uniref:SDR family oxidoreductase n=1 Tax=Algoriphagus sp. TaxID=1872435 RepID=UPI00391A6052